MPKLKLGPIVDDKPVKVSVELSARLYRDLIAYAEILGRDAGQPPVDPGRLIIPMLERFIATDRGFAKARRTKMSMSMSMKPEAESPHCEIGPSTAQGSIAGEPPDCRSVATTQR